MTVDNFVICYPGNTLKWPEEQVDEVSIQLDQSLLLHLERRRHLQRQHCVL